MKKILGAAVVAAMIAIPMTASAAPQASAVQSQASTNVVSPEYQTQYVTVQQSYSKFMYPDSFSIPYSYYYNQNTYSGWLNRTTVLDFGTSWYVTYSGFVTSYYY